MNPSPFDQVQSIPQNQPANPIKSAPKRNWLLIALVILFVGPVLLMVGVVGLLVFVAFLGSAVRPQQASTEAELQAVPVKADATKTLQIISDTEGASPDKAGVLNFKGNRYVLAYATGDAEKGIINEYIAEGESLDTWTKMISVRYNAILVEPKVFANNVVQVISEKYPDSNPHIYVGQKTGSARVDFVLNGGDFAELNIFIYQTPANAEGLISYQYAERAYGDQVAAFMQQSQDKIDELTPFVVDFDFPTLTTNPTH